MNDRKFDLNIEKILEDWKTYHAIREIIANALDEQMITQTKAIEIFKDTKNNWHIRDFGRGLRYEHLTQNESEEKAKHTNLIGKFGVGLKDALATFYRNKIKVLIKSKYGDITLGEASKAGFEDIKTLHAYISTPSNQYFIGTEFILSNCSDNDICKAKNLFFIFSSEKILEKSSYGDVLLKNGEIATIYINGVKVAEEENFLFSYNITSINASIRKALNRERTNVGRNAYSDRIKTILLSSKEKSIAEKLIYDLQNFETGNSHDELKWIDVSLHAVKILNSVEKVVFMTPPELIQAARFVEIARQSGYQIITIPENLKQKMNEEVDLKGNPIIDLTNFQKEWVNSFSFKFVDYENLSLQEKSILEKINYVLDLIGGRPSAVKEIKISETMIIDQNTFSEAVGLWSSPYIIIKRSQLSDEKLFWGTLLHEIAHVRSLATDVTLNFELELTNLLGQITTKGILYNNQFQTDNTKTKPSFFKSLFN